MRQCRGCTLCCKLVPVKEIDKRGGMRCQHQRTGKGCAVYKRAGFPVSCALWSCRWLSDPDAAALRRPDRSHYVIDIMPDTILMTSDGGAPVELTVLQVWLDPRFPEAHRDPALRSYMDAAGVAAIMRWDERRGFVLFPPSVTGTGRWHEEHNGQVVEREAFPVTRNDAHQGELT